MRKASSIIRHQPIMLIFPPIMLCCSAQNFNLLCSILCSCKNDLCLKSDCSIRVYLLVFHMLSVLLEYIKFYIEIISMVSVLLEY